MITRLGLPVVERYVANVPLDAALAYVEQHQLEGFVIKPNSSRSSIGCRSLVREGRRFRDVRFDRTVDLKRLKRELVRSVARMNRSDAWVLEELLLPANGALAPLDDFKFYCFGGRTEFIAHIWKLARKPWKRWNCYSRDWDPVEVFQDKSNHAAASAPIVGPRMLAIAEEVSARLCYPFIRVDLYDTSRGVVVGELTPGPGRRYKFSAAWDDRLSRRWHEVAQDLQDGVRSGRIRPLFPPESGSA